MPIRPDADLVLAGGGAAGLGALWHLLDHGPRLGRIVLVDRDFEVGDDRTWAFWGPPDAPLAELADTRWHRLRVRFPGWETTADLDALDYVRIRRRDHDERLLAMARAAPNVELVAAEILDVVERTDHAVVVTTEGDLVAPYVFQSVRRLPAPTPRHPLRQHFGGLEVRTGRPVFDPDVVTFMDVDVPQTDGLTFVYVLPESPTAALVEHTVFSPTVAAPEVHDAAVAAYLDRLGARSWAVDRAEYGAIPMEDRPRRVPSGRVHHLGTVGGRTKPSTGYTFRRMQIHADHLARTWARTGAPRSLPPTKWRFHEADRLLLNVLHRRPDDAVRVFERLFRSLSVPEVLAFLDESVTVRAQLSMMAKMPWSPFLDAIVDELRASRAAHLDAQPS